MSGFSPHKPFDKIQFENLFKENFQLLCNFARQYVGDDDTAQDICQRVFIALWEKRDQIDITKSIKSYLFTSIKNRCLNHIRDHKKFRSKVLDLDCGNFDLFTEEEHFAEEELKNKIEKALEKLPDKCRKVFEMSRFQNMKYREIAEELDIAQKTVEAHMSKAMKLLRQDLKEYYTIAMIVLALPEFIANLLAY